MAETTSKVAMQREVRAHDFIEVKTYLKRERNLTIKFKNRRTVARVKHIKNL